MNDFLKNKFSVAQVICLCLFLLAVAVYSNTLFNGFAVDDLSVIEQNTIVKKGFSGIPELLVTPRLKGFGEVTNDSYRPLSLRTFAVEYQFFGLNPFVGHLVNVFLFGCCVVLLFIFLNRLFPDKMGIALAAAILFAVHPIHTEVVANIKSRDELMCFFFAFAALNLFMNYEKDGRTYLLPAGSILLLLSYLSKETVISFLFVIPLVFFFYKREHRKRSIFTATLAITSLFLITRAVVLKGHDTTAVPFLDNPLAGPYLSARLPTAIKVLGMYLELLIVPWPLISDYSYDTISMAGFGSLMVWIWLAAYLLLLYVGVSRCIKYRDPLAFGILFYLGTLFLFSNIFFLVYSEMGERFLFFASAGFCIGISALLWELFLKIGAKSIVFVPRMMWLVIIPVSLIYIALTVVRNAEWKNNYTLFSTDVKRAPNNSRLLHSLGYVLFTMSPEDEPDPIIRKKMADDGIAYLQRSVAVYPANAEGHRDLENFFRGMGQFDSAEYHVKEWMKLEPNNPAPINDLGFIYFSMQRYYKALDVLQVALKFNKDKTRTLNNMAMCYMQLRKPDSALIVLNHALAIDPTDQHLQEYVQAVKTEIAKRDSVIKNK
jgi:protein O-mannosyl-transferase